MPTLARKFSPRICLLAAGALATCLPATAHASHVRGKVELLWARATDGLLYVRVTGTPTTRPTCAAATPYYIIQNESSELGRIQYAMLMSAYLAATPVEIIGSGTCTRWSDGEDIESVNYYTP